MSSNTKMWCLQEELLLHKLKIAGKSYKEIADVLEHVEGRREYTENCCKKKWNGTNWDEVFAKEKEYNEMVNGVLDSDNEKQKIIDSTLATQEKMIKRDKARTDLMIEAMKSAIYRLPRPKKITYSPSKNSKHSEEHAALLLSDLHVGASYTLEDTGGLSEFNIDIFNRRLQKLKESVLHIVERHKSMYNVPHLHLICLGDIVAGMKDAGAWSPNYIDMDVYDQMLAGVNALRDVIAEWSQAFQNVTFYGLYGNHGRIGKPGQQKVYTNWDRICYKFIETSLQDYQNIEWNIPTAWFLQTDIMGHSFYLTHGDGIRGSMGIPYYGVERAERNIMGLLDKKPEYFCLGHFHSPAEIQTNSGRILMNGCFTSDTQVWLPDGRTTAIKNVKIGDEIIGKELVATKVTNNRHQKYEGEIVCFRVMGNSNIIKCTPNHEMLSIKGSKLHDIPTKRAEGGKYNPLKSDITDVCPDFVPSEYLSVGDYIAQVYDKNIPATGHRADNKEQCVLKITEPFSKLEWWKDKVLDKSFCRFIGYYLAEGSISGANGKNHWVNLCFNMAEKKYISLSEEELQKIGLHTRIYTREERHTTEVCANGKEFCDAMVLLCNKNSQHKRLHPIFIKQVPRSLQLETLVGYLQGDGHACKTTRSNGSFSIMSASKSKDLRDQMAYISINCGYTPYIRTQKGNSKRNTMYWMFFRGNDAIDLSVKCDMPFDREFSEHTSRSFIECDNYTLRKITQCWTETYSGEVYDLEVSGQESYNVEGLVCHNSFMGGDMYSLRDLRKADRAEQKFFGIHKDNGVTWSYNIQLDSEG